MAKNTMKVNAPKDIIRDLRIRYPKMRDSDLIRMVYHTSLVKADITLEPLFRDKKRGKLL